MFKRKPQSLSDVLNRYLREEGLEMPLLQHRLLDTWDDVVGKMVAGYTLEKRIQNQTLYVKISNPALRQDLSMMRSQLVQRLNGAVGSMVISDIRFF